MNYLIRVETMNSSEIFKIRVGGQRRRFISRAKLFSLTSQRENFIFFVNLFCENCENELTLDAAWTTLTLGMFEASVGWTWCVERRTQGHGATHRALHASACLAGIKLPSFAILPRKN